MGKTKGKETDELGSEENEGLPEFDNGLREVKVKATGKNPFRAEGKVYMVTERKAGILEAKGWAKKV